MAKTNTNPEVRFAGFTESWEERELGDVAKFNPKHEIPDVFNYVDLESVVGTEMISYRKEYKISAPSRAQRLAEKGDVFYQTVRPYQKNNLLFDREDKDFVFSTGYAQLRPIIESSFLFTLIQKDEFVRIVLNNCTGTSYPAINSTVLASIKQYFPKSKDEQKLIGNFFGNLDNLITEHQHKHSKLKSLKQAMLNKMFPKHGQLVPEIRFKGFEREWEEKKLSELSNYCNGKGYESFQSSSGKYELINLNSISIDGGLKPSGKFINQADTTLKKNDLVMVLSDVGHGDLLGRVALIPEDDKYVLNQRVALLRPNKDVSPYFLYYNINANQLYFKTQGAGMSQLNLSKKSVEDFTSLIPKEIDEQIEIADYFINIDHLIVNHGTQISKLQNIKKAFLAKMFI